MKECTGIPGSTPHAPPFSEKLAEADGKNDDTFPARQDYHAGATVLFPVREREGRNTEKTRGRMPSADAEKRRNRDSLRSFRSHPIIRTPHHCIAPMNFS